MDTRIWSDEQNEIYNEFQFGTSNVVVVARAGVGKTTTAMHGVGLMPEPKVTMCAFNRRIADELNTRLKRDTRRGGIQAKTLHGLGASIVYRFWEGVALYDMDKHPVSRADLLTNEVATLAPDAIKRLISKLHSMARETTPYAQRGSDLIDLAIQFECVPDEGWEEQGFDLDFVCTRAAAAMELAATVKPKFIDYSDMIYLPLRNRWTHKTQDAVVVDEAQDMTLAQLDLALGVCKGRVFIIGDDKQAIYGFRGADSGSLTRLETQLNAKRLTLTTTYRCGHAIVAEAQKLVPDFQAGPSNPAGEVLTLPASKLVPTVAAGDFVLSRVNAPLVSVAMRLLKEGRRVRIAGKQIGKGVIALVRKLKARSVPDLLTKINNWQAREIKRVEARQGNEDAKRARIEAILDQADMLTTVCAEAKSVDEAIKRIEALFHDDGLGDAGVVTCSSVHRSKGLEARRVFVLADTLKDWDQEERNIRYVAITRAIETLVYVHGAL